MPCSLLLSILLKISNQSFINIFYFLLHNPTLKILNSLYYVNLDTI
jgi:hypothetical protein